MTLVFSSMRRLVPLLIAATALAAPAGAQAAGWGSGAPAGPPGRYTSSQGLAIQTGDRPAVLTQTYDRHAARRSALLLHRAGRPTRTVATSRTSFEGAGLAAGPHGELIAAWLEIVGGSRRPVVATGPTLADRQVLAPGPRSTQYLSFAADARGDAVVAFWRYEGTQFAVWASYRPAGGRFSAAQRLATGDVDNPQVAIEDDGSASVVFGDEHGVRVVDHAPAATAFTAPQALPGVGRPTSDAAVARSGGRTTIAWVGTATGGAPSVLVSDRLGAGAAFSAPVGLSAASMRLRRDPPPAVAFDGDRALVSWVEGTAGTSTHDHAALATSTAPGRWEPVQTRGVTAPTHVAVTRLTSGAHGRRALLLMTTQRGGRYRTLTASVRADGTLGPTRAPAALARSSSYFAYAAQGVRHTYVLADHPLGRGGVFQPTLVSSAP